MSTLQAIVCNSTLITLHYIIGGIAILSVGIAAGIFIRDVTRRRDHK